MNFQLKVSNQIEKKTKQKRSRKGWEAKKKMIKNLGGIGKKLSPDMRPCGEVKKRKSKNILLIYT